MTNDLTIHLVDDEEVLRRSLTFLLVSAGFAVRAHSCAKAFLDILPLSGRNCLVTDLRMPDVNGIELLHRLRRFSADVPAIVITGQGDIAAAVQAMKAGASDFLEKPLGEEALIAAINLAMGQRRPGCAVADSESVAARVRQLTDREHQVLNGVLDGLQNKMIAYHLGISSRTVEVHRANVMAKMGARNLAELMRMAIAIDAVEQPTETGRISPADTWPACAR
ncbi:two-component system response regulator FixJ [Rhizobium leguminosarum]|uniref:Two-component system response regulator FixJ n=1 Tax=Rhizobium leguminosarum TaxID=384 RepID=A0AAE2MII4_RHILE|nr:MULTISPECIES: response regulator [Rhizobium]MBB4289911.1 two-component system response regulator FixJ [Rhizobium leguminosarum]MBB4296555.1 two-component system response regulator FixJ [Rhizobium leguminosarum]MBB4308185.1 two-component system response regulator FixJ [Rhizobium leguminosarum]MBB4416020.1 two-component system response regulator FixJ [Rhizobium leguminosarum]MBB4431013.1 two-component system response regulator FixJ [Rhizobium esperanzae]